jgi:hypothetical protein
MSGAGRRDLYRICVKLYAREPHLIESDAEAFVPIFHEWIRDQVLDLVLLDVADYAHAPDSPGIMLVSYETNFALDRADGRFGLLAQRRTPVEGGGGEAIATTLRHALQVAALLEQDPRITGKLAFDPSTVRVEANDRLLAPNSDEGYAAFEPLVQEAVTRVYGEAATKVERVANDPRDRLSVDVQLPGVVPAEAIVGV